MPVTPVTADTPPREHRLRGAINRHYRHDRRLSFECNPVAAEVVKSASVTPMAFEVHADRRPPQHSPSMVRQGGLDLDGRQRPRVGKIG